MRSLARYLGAWSGVSLICQVCRFDPWPGNTQQATNKDINKNVKC